MRVDLVAYALEENKGSEPGSGWTALRAHLNNGHEVRIFTTIENFLLFKKSSFSEKKNIEIIAVEPIRWAKKLLKYIPFSTQINYHLWMLKVGIKLRKQLKYENQSGIVHHATYAGDWNLNAILFLSRSQKSYWGPIGGYQKMNLNEFFELSLRGKFIETIRYGFLSPLRTLIRFSVSRKNLTVLAMNQAVQEYFSHKIRSVYCPNLILDFQKKHLPAKKKYIFSSGRLIPIKNFKLLISAMQYIDSDTELIIAGEGFLRESLTRQIKKLGLIGRVHLIGHVPREKTIELLVNSAVFAFTSTRDSHSWSLAEAVHLGIPVATIGTPGNISVLKNQSF